MRFLKKKKFNPKPRYYMGKVNVRQPQTSIIHAVRIASWPGKPTKMAQGHRVCTGGEVNERRIRKYWTEEDVTCLGCLAEGVHGNP